MPFHAKHKISRLKVLVIPVWISLGFQICEYSPPSSLDHLNKAIPGFSRVEIIFPWKYSNRLMFQLN